MFIKKTHIIFIKAFFTSTIYFCAFLLSKGFGWDGDSVSSASHLVKIINPNMFRFWHGGSVPKLMSIFTFGIFYKIFGSFYALTILSIIINSAMVALICKWVFESGGYWYITFIGLVSYIGWLNVVITCDSVAFSVPFIFFGLYYYFHKTNKIIGSFLIFIACLYRPGPEIIFLFIMFIELKKNNKNILFLTFLFFLFLAGIMHTLYGYRLVYINRDDLLTENNLMLLRCISSYKHSLTAIFPYIHSISSQLLKPRAFIFLILALFGLTKLIKINNDIKFAGLSIFASYILPITTFAYGATIFNSTYHMEVPVLLAIFSGFFCYKNAFIQNILIRLKYKTILKIMILLFLLILVFYKGLRQRGTHEITPDGNGVLKRKSLPEVKELFKGRSGLKAAITKQDLSFFILDLGVKLKKLDILRNAQDIRELRCNDYDIILLSQDTEGYYNNNCSDLKKIYIDDSRVIFIRK